MTLGEQMERSVPEYTNPHKAENDRVTATSSEWREAVEMTGGLRFAYHLLCDSELERSVGFVASRDFLYEQMLIAMIAEQIAFEAYILALQQLQAKLEAEMLADTSEF